MKRVADHRRSATDRNSILGPFRLGMLLLLGVSTSPLALDDPLSASATSSNLVIENNLCAVAPRDSICDALPHDVSDFNASLVYTLIEKDAQDPFDVFSWQTFVALNWPDGEGRPRWQSFDQPDGLFGQPGDMICDPDEIAESGAIRVRDHIQSQGLPLIDQDGNYVVYDVRIGPEMAAYIRENRLGSKEGQQAFLAGGGVLDYPKGYYTDPAIRRGGRPGAIAIKSAWRVFEDPEPSTRARFLTRPGRIEVSPGRSLSGEANCLAVTLGLVGFHIMRRTRSGNGGDWIWTTFEHRDNAPLAANARGVNSIFATPLFPHGCVGGAADHRRDYSFHDANCEGCRTNRLISPRSDWRWDQETPFAGPATPKPQVVRCWRPARSTEAVNQVWQQALETGPLSHYALSTTQWKGAPTGALFPAGEVPRYATNTTMETYIQDSPAGSCLGCHAGATLATGQSADFSFLLERAQSAGTPGR